jgi:hypothetical protein
LQLQSVVGKKARWENQFPTDWRVECSKKAIEEVNFKMETFGRRLAVQLVNDLYA